MGKISRRERLGLLILLIICCLIIGGFLLLRPRPTPLSVPSDPAVLSADTVVAADSLAAPLPAKKKPSEKKTRPHKAPPTPRRHLEEPF